MTKVESEEKNFIDWFDLKPKLHNSLSFPKYFNERDVWWCNVGANIGHEVDGKSSFYTRPVIVLKKLSSNTFLGIPFTSKEKEGTWYVGIDIKGKKSIAMLNQIRSLDKRRMMNKIGRLDKKDFEMIREKMIDLIKYSSPDKRGNR